MNPFLTFYFFSDTGGFNVQRKKLKQKIRQNVPVRNRGLSRDLLFGERKPGISSTAYSHDDAQIIQ